MSAYVALHVVERSTKRRPTGVPGINYFRSAGNRRDGTVQEFLSVFTRTPEGRRRNTRVCISTRGKSDAWRRALAIRAAYERQIASHPTPHTK
jgi:hypothetical protein